MQKKSSRAEPSPPANVFSVLLVSPREGDHASLRHILGRSNWTLHQASDCREALAFLHRHQVPVVICDRDLPDGNWSKLLEEAAKLPDPPSLIVSSRLADERLWAEVLNLGGYDVLPTPFEEAEVLRVTSLAWHSWPYHAPAESPRGCSAGL